MNRKQQGALGEAMAIAYYTQQGYNVFVPVSDVSRYDLIVDNGTGPKRVQVKSTGFQRTENSSYVVGLSTQGGNRSWQGEYKYISIDETDLVFIYALDGRMWELPVAKCAGKRGICLGDKYLGNEVFFKVSFSVSNPNSNANKSSKSIKICFECGKEIDRRATTGLCKSCRNKSGNQVTKINWPATDILIKMVQESNYTQVAKSLGVSDSAIRKRIKNH